MYVQIGCQLMKFSLQMFYLAIMFELYNIELNNLFLRDFSKTL